MTTVHSTTMSYLRRVAETRDALATAVKALHDLRYDGNVAEVYEAAYVKMRDLTIVIEQSVARGDVPRHVAEMYGWVAKENDDATL